jgi:transcriptional regulator with XRE-family HTH domain
MTTALREWRTARGWTLADVGGLTGLTVSYLSLVERGLRDPSPPTKVVIARGVGAAVVDIFPRAAEREAASA